MAFGDKKILTPAQIWLKIQFYCAYTERSEYQVIQKLKEWNLTQALVDETVDKLIDDNFLNNNRFIEQYIRAKFIQKKWGKQKIKQGLVQQHHISTKVILEKINELISEADYLKTVQQLGDKKLQLLKNQHPEYTSADLYQKIVAFLLQRGFEMDSIKKCTF